MSEQSFLERLGDNIVVDGYYRKLLDQFKHPGQLPFDYPGEAPSDEPEKLTDLRNKLDVGHTLLPPNTEKQSSRKMNINHPLALGEHTIKAALFENIKLPTMSDIKGTIQGVVNDVTQNSFGNSVNKFMGDNPWMQWAGTGAALGGGLGLVRGLASRKKDKWKALSDAAGGAVLGGLAGGISQPVFTQGKEILDNLRNKATEPTVPPPAVPGAEIPASVDKMKSSVPSMAKAPVDSIRGLAHESTPDALKGRVDKLLYQGGERAGEAQTAFDDAKGLADSALSRTYKGSPTSQILDKAYGRLNDINSSIGASPLDSAARTAVLEEPVDGTSVSPSRSFTDTAKTLSDPKASLVPGALGGGMFAPTVETKVTPPTPLTATEKKLGVPERQPVSEEFNTVTGDKLNPTPGIGGTDLDKRLTDAIANTGAEDSSSLSVPLVGNAGIGLGAQLGRNTAGSLLKNQMYTRTGADKNLTRMISDHVSGKAPFTPEQVKELIGSEGFMNRMRVHTGGLADAKQIADYLGGKSVDPIVAAKINAAMQQYSGSPGSTASGGGAPTYDPVTKTFKSPPPIVDPARESLLRSSGIPKEVKGKTTTDIENPKYVAEQAKYRTISDQYVRASRAGNSDLAEKLFQEKLKQERIMDATPKTVGKSVEGSVPNPAYTKQEGLVDDLLKDPNKAYGVSNRTFKNIGANHPNIPVVGKHIPKLIRPPQTWKGNALQGLLYQLAAQGLNPSGGFDSPLYNKGK